MKIDVRKYAVYDPTIRSVLKAIKSSKQAMSSIDDTVSFLDDVLIRERYLLTGREFGEKWPGDDIWKRHYTDKRYDSPPRELINANMVHSFDEKGRNIIQYSDEILEMFKATVIDDNSALTDLHLPYDAFYISAAYRHIDGAIVSLRGSWLRISTFYRDDITGQGFVSRYALLNSETGELIREPEDGLDFADHLNLILNCLIYISNYKEEAILMRPPNTPESLLKKLAREKKAANVQKTQDTLIKLGFQKVLYCGYGEEFEKQYELDPHWRRGHWRSQPCGPERAERKTIWIKPVLVRRDKGLPKHGHVYQVEMPTSV